MWYFILYINLSLASRIWVYENGNCFTKMKINIRGK